MVRRYDVICSRCSSHFRVKIDVFLSITFNNKSKSRKVFIYVLFFMKSTKSRSGFKINNFQKSFRNTATYQKLWGEVPSTTPFPLLKCTTVGGMNLCVRPRVDMFLKSNSLSGTHALYSLLNSSNKVLWAKRFRKMEYRPRNCRGFLLST